MRKLIYFFIFLMFVFYAAYGQGRYGEGSYSNAYSSNDSQKSSSSSHKEEKIDSYFISSLSSGHKYKFEFKGTMSVRNIYIIPSTDLSSAKIEVEHLDKIPDGLPDLENYFSVEKITFSSSNSVLDRVFIQFRLLDKLVEKYNSSSIVLKHFNGSVWEDLPTKFIYRAGKWFYFEAESPGFSYFAVSLSDSSVEENNSFIDEEPSSYMNETNITGEENESFVNNNTSNETNNLNNMDIDFNESEEENINISNVSSLEKSHPYKEPSNNYNYSLLSSIMQFKEVILTVILFVVLLIILLYFKYLR